MPRPVDAVVIGGGPAGSAVGRLLASWGHAVRIVDAGGDRARGLAESIPPSTHKLLATIGCLESVERAAFYRTRGNIVSWASTERRVETFADDQCGLQVFRPDFDRVLLECATAAGAELDAPAYVRRVVFGDGCATVEYDRPASLTSRTESVAARFVLDCSGRAGVVGRRYRRPEPGYRTLGLVGVWRLDEPWPAPDDTYTIVETFADGWAWSVPTTARVRHVGAMVGDARFADGGPRDLDAAYRSRITNAAQLSRLLQGAALERVFACDASLYSSDVYAGPQFLLVGDAGSFIDPLSSFGVKKALASAWLAAVAVHTALTDPSRASVALDFFSDWERRVYASHLRRSREFARTAAAAHPHPFWSARADAPAAIEDADVDELGHAHEDADVRRAFERFRTAPAIDLAMTAAPLEQRPVVRGNEIVLEPALSGGMRFAANVDLLKLAEMAPQHRQVPDLFEAYCRTCAAVPLPNVVGGLSLLVARGILYERT